MSSFNFIGNEWAGGDASLLTTVLRDEWGFDGNVITDANFFTYMNMDQAVMNGGNLNLSTFDLDMTANAGEAAYAQNLRESAKSICYSLANSGAMSGIKPGSIVTVSKAGWEIAVIVWDVVAVVLVAAGIAWMVVRTKKMKEQK